MSSVHDICSRRQWRCHGTATDRSHVHLVASWIDDTDPFAARTTFKRLLGLALARAAGTRGIPYLSAGAGITQVKTIKHLNYLLCVYFPTHSLWWREPRRVDPI